ncbi:MAG: PQQ-dependent sugar dehydrogenase [Myxococcaceae bacterium]|nr:PQQ-dependent sugar dehydrogenase [Myxococcaceae bacterium]
MRAPSAVIVVLLAVSGCDGVTTVEGDGGTAGGSTTGDGGTGGGAAGGNAGGAAGGDAGGAAGGDAGGSAGGSTAGGSTAGGSAGGFAGGSTAGGSAGGSTAGGSGGGSTAGGSAAGGSAAGGSAAGGSAAGGSAGGSAAGGSAAGGSAAGGSAAGGSAAGGSAAGGSAAGGSAAGGTAAGGSAAGGSAAGGSAAGGSAAGGSTGWDGGPYTVVNDGGFGYLTRPANPTCIAPPRPTNPTNVQLVRAFPNITFNQPLLLMQAPGDPGRIFVMQRGGTVRSFPNVPTAQQTDVTNVISITVDTAGEGGLLGMAFHPQWATRKELFLSYTRTGRGGGVPLISVISRFRSTDNGLTFNPASEERLLELDQPFSNHNGGMIAFGPDGFLYIGFGDGGSGGDPNNAGQLLNTNHGKFVRIDVDVPFVNDGGVRYGIPPTNPFASTGVPCNQTTSSRTVDGGSVVRCAEIYAWGVRNPWRWSFDQGTGQLWAGDVGQGVWEEVDVITNGGNYGWRTCEGFYRQGSSTNLCNTPGHLDPVVAYDRSMGNSITGGYVYRGTAAPGLVGRYVFGDYGNGAIYAIREDPMTGARSIETIGSTSGLASFGQTLDGEVYTLNLFNGTISRFQQASADAGVVAFPARLSQTGCFTSTTPTQPVPALIPFAVNSQLWSDGALKERSFAIPDGTTIALQPDGDFDFPNGTVTVKTFSLGGQKIETRLLVRHSDGQWAGYTYEWRADQTDADLLPAGKTKVVGSQTWLYPSRGQCMTCHTAAAGRSLGPELAQLNSAITWPRGVTANQLETLAALGYFSGPLPAPAPLLPRLPDPLGASGTVEERARSYLHSNCSNCHRMGAVPGPQDFRYALTFRQTNVCNVMPTSGNAGVPGALLFAPMDPSRSLISIRTKALNVFRMPPLGSSVVDAQGTALLDAWINSVTSCP